MLINERKLFGVPLIESVASTTPAPAFCDHRVDIKTLLLQPAHEFRRFAGGDRAGDGEKAGFHSDATLTPSVPLIRGK